MTYVVQTVLDDRRSELLTPHRVTGWICGACPHTELHVVMPTV